MKEYYDSNPNHSNYIAIHVGKQGAYSAEIGAQAQVFEKSATESKSKLTLLCSKNIVNTATFNITINQQPKFTASASEHNTKIICMQEHR